jgi:hypothetical protein
MDPRISKFSDAIEKAEGYGVPGALPTRINNPGDLCLGDKGWGVTEGKTNFPSYEIGRAALDRESALICTGTSHVYRLSDTIMQVALKYTGGDNALAWATTVSGHLGVMTTTTIYDYMNLPSGGDLDAASNPGTC